VENGRFFVAGAAGKPHFDLPGYVAERLRAAGVEPEILGFDTYADPDRFYSYRRAIHRREADYGRQVSLIGLTGASA
jgi:copper oxidase (laccase) domain-containing protein